MPSLPKIPVMPAATVFPSGSIKRRKKEAVQLDDVSSDDDEVLPDFSASESDEEI